MTGCERYIDESETTGMKNYIAIIVLVLSIVPSALSAQEFEYPVLPETGRSIADFIPEGWHLTTDTASGDLNDDLIPDYAVIIQKTDTLWLPGDTEEEVFHNIELMRERPRPRFLVILLAEEDRRLIFATQSSLVLLPENADGMFVDPLQGLIIDSGMVSIGYYGGLGWRYAASYDFKLHEGRWVLARASKLSYHTSGELKGSLYQYNFIKGIVAIIEEYSVFVECLPCDDCGNCNECEECPDPCTECYEPKDVVIIRDLEEGAPFLFETFEPFENEIIEGEYL